MNWNNLSPGLVAYYDFLPGNGEGLFSKEKVSKEVDKKGKISKEKSIGKWRNQVNKHHHHHNHITALFPGPLGWAGARRELLDFMVQVNKQTMYIAPKFTNELREHYTPETAWG